ncbi:MAG: choice-of-anchor D domain-containing protein [Bacteroidota bacterium]|nr:choice-of-anchor D domain-containing protein [Bacteroidota bacterium]
MIPRSLPTVTFLVCCAMFSTTSAQQWEVQPINPSNIPGLWGIAMFDSGRGIAVGAAAIPNGLSGIIRRSTGNDTWQNVPVTAFSPSLSTGFSFWSGTTARKNSGTAWVCGQNGKVYKTTDYGVSWVEKTNGINGAYSLFDIYFKSHTEGLVVGASGVAYYTTNGGDSWTALNTGTTNALYAVHTGGQTWFVTGENNTMLRFDPPSTWTNISSSLLSGNGTQIEGLQFLNDLEGFYCGYNPSGTTHVWRTTNGGASWSGFPTEPPVGTGNYYCTLFFFSRTDGWVANAFNGIAHTSNGGNTWTTYTPQGSGTGAILRLDFIDQQRGWAAGGAMGGGPIPLGFVLKYTGPPPAPDISTTQTTIDFGTIACAKSKDAILIIRNTGTLALAVTSISFSSSHYTVVSPLLPISIPPGDSAVATIRWQPPSTFFGTIADTLTISSNDASYPQWKVRIEGSRELSGIVFTPQNLNFSPLCGRVFADTSIEGQPTGNVFPTILSFEHFTGDTGVVLLSPQLGSVVSGPTPFTFRFRTEKLGALGGTYILRAGNPSCPDSIFIGFTANHRKNTLVATPAVFDFGEICTGTYRDGLITLRNTGNTPATIIARELVSGKDVFPNLHPGGFGPIAASATGDYSVRFAPSPTDTGWCETLYRLIIGPCADTTYITLRGRAVRPVLITDPSAVLRFGPITVGQSEQTRLRFTNKGTGTMRITSIRLNPPSNALMITDEPMLPVNLPEKHSDSVLVRFIPTRIETVNTLLCIRWDEPCADSICIPVTAIADQVPGIVTIDSIDFGLQACPPVVRDSFVVRNSGPGQLNLQSFSIAGANPTHFRVLRPVPPFLLPAGDSIFVVVEYNSPVEGVSRAILTISHNDPKAGNASSIVLTGRRTVTEFTVEGDSATVFRACIKTTVERMFRIRNISTHPLEVKRIASAGGAWNVYGKATPFILPPDDTASFTVSFHPTVAGSSRGSITVVSEPCTLTHVLQPEGLASASALVFSPSSVNLGTVTIGSTATAVVRITNAGPDAITCTSMFVDSPGGRLSIRSAPTMPLTLQGVSSESVTIEFNPTAPGSMIGRLCVVTSAPCPDTLCVSVLAVVRAESIAFDCDSVFQHLDPCIQEGRSDTITLRNDSPRSVTISSIAIDPPAWFRIEPAVPTPFALTSGQSRTLVIHSDPFFTGERTAVLRVMSDDPVAPLLELPLRAVRDSARLTAIPPILSYGMLARCFADTTNEVLLENSGTIADSLFMLRAPSPPFGTSSTFPMRIEPAGHVLLPFTFTPTKPGSFTDTVIFLSGACRQVIHLILEGSRDTIHYRVQPTPLVFTGVIPGGNKTDTLFVENLNLPQARIKEIHISPPGTFTYTGAVPLVIGPSGTVPLPILFSPSGSGRYEAIVSLIFDTPCPDTIDAVLRGMTDDNPLAFTAVPLSFPPLAQCRDTVLRDTLQNRGTFPIMLSGSTVTGAGAQGFTVLDPVTGNETLQPGGFRPFHIRFNPAVSAEGPVTAALVVTTIHPAFPSVQLPLEGTRVTQSLPSAVLVDFGTIAVGLPARKDISIGNPGTSSYTITSVVFPAEITPPMTPITIGAGGWETITLTWTPTITGTRSIDGRLIVGEPCPDSIPVTLTAQVSGGVALASHDFGVVPSCSSTESSTMFRNATPLSVRIIEVKVTGPDSAFFHLVSPISFPVTVNADDSLPLTVRFTPDPPSGNRGYATFLECTGEGFSTPGPVRASLTADAVVPVPNLRYVPDFGVVPIHTNSAELPVVFFNSYPFPLRIITLHTLDTQYVLRSVSPPLPAVLAPGDSLIARMVFTPVSGGDFSGRLIHVETDEPCAESSDYTIRGSGLDDYVEANVSIPTIEGRIDEHILVPLNIDADLGTAHVTSWEGGIGFDATMLYPLRAVAEGSRSSSMNVVGTYDLRSGEYRLKAEGGRVEGGTGPLAFVEFLVLLGRHEQCALEPRGLGILQGRARILSQRNGTFRLTGYCAAEGRRLVAERIGTFLFPNTPNPFTASTEIPFRMERDAFVELYVLDAMGRPVGRLIASPMKAGEHRVRFDARDLPAGVYHLVLHCGGETRTRSIVLTR